MNHTSYTIDTVFIEGEGWHWHCYTNGGGLRFYSGLSESLEAALDDAKRQCIIEHRTDKPIA